MDDTLQKLAEHLCLTGPTRAERFGKTAEPRESSYIKDFVSGVDPFGVITFRSARDNELAGSKRHGRHRAVATAGGVVGGAAVVTPGIMGTIAGLRGLLSRGGGGWKGRILRGAAGLRRGVVAPYKGVYQGHMASRGLAAAAAGRSPSARQIKAMNSLVQGVPIKGLAARFRGLEGVNLAAGVPQELRPITQALSGIIRSRTLDSAAMLGAAGGLSGGAAFLQYGAGADTGRRLGKARRDSLRHALSQHGSNIPHVGNVGDKTAANLTKLAPKWSDRDHIVTALQQHLTDAQAGLGTETEAKELTDLGLIVDAYRRSQLAKREARRLQRDRVAKFRQYADAPSLAEGKTAESTDDDRNALHDWLALRTEKQASAGSLLAGGLRLAGRGIASGAGIGWRGARSGLGLTRGWNARAVHSALRSGANRPVFDQMTQAARQAGVKGPSLINPMNWITPVSTAGARFTRAGRSRWLAQQAAGNTRGWQRVAGRMAPGQADAARNMVMNTQVRAPAGILKGQAGRMSIPDAIERTRPRAIPYTAASYAVWEPMTSGATRALGLSADDGMLDQGQLQQ